MLALDSIIEEETLNNKQLQDIFQKILRSSVTENSTKSSIDSFISQRKFHFEELFPPAISPIKETPQTLASVTMEEESIAIEIESKTFSTTTAVLEETENDSISFMTDEELKEYSVIAEETADNYVSVTDLGRKTAAFSKNLLSDHLNTIELFGENLYFLLAQFPAGLNENEIARVYYKHYGVYIPFKYQSSMMKYLIAHGSHLFIIHYNINDNEQQNVPISRTIFLRNILFGKKFLNLDELTLIKLKQWFKYLLTSENEINGSSKMLKLSQLQNSFQQLSNSLFITRDLYSLVKSIPEIRKICVGNGDLADYFITWSSVLNIYCICTFVDFAHLGK